ncbi:hypothetical protein AX774_g3864 [Zancudomyces culisetae]|uniref:Uncharacterized protein n=1 Tax=Zancudomyces culisetae TaxID=1213189 RepID=A0A1R1PNV7_ZANCU|nr:hypothetical protein AX774_g3864 [Zancudomyces culisetae]|eukprot:OMH82649.1 hypothetical protein AX774_g3864 [Zancudomyces culisetae]
MINEGYKSFPSGHSSGKPTLGPYFRIFWNGFFVIVFVIPFWSQDSKGYHLQDDDYIVSNSHRNYCCNLKDNRLLAPFWGRASWIKAKDFSDDAPPGNINQHHQGYEELLDESSELRDLSNSASVINMH